MYLTRHQMPEGPRWALDGNFLPLSFDLRLLLELPASTIDEAVSSLTSTTAAIGPLLPPIESLHEVWACGVTYMRSREARKAESETGDIYDKVYDADRPEVFFKSVGWRVVGHGAAVRVRRDSAWNVPEPELTLVVNTHGEIVGYCAGNDMSSRDIEGQNPLYLPQAKTYRGACAIGPGIMLAAADTMRDLPIHMEISRNGQTTFEGETAVSRMKRSLEDLVSYACREIDIPYGMFLMTGTGIVPGDDFSLQPGDHVKIIVGSLTLENETES